jgi:hypothetical protein
MADGDSARTFAKFTVSFRRRPESISHPATPCLEKMDSGLRRNDIEPF